MSFNQAMREQLKKDLINSIGASEFTFHFVPAEFATRHQISIQTVYRYLQQFESDEIITSIRLKNRKIYRLVDRTSFFDVILDGASEDKIWRESIRPMLTNMPEIAFRNCNYAFTEMLNNAIDHSGGTKATVQISYNPYRVRISIHDNGIGIFTKIASAMNLDEKRFAVLELAKGKFTTDPNSHTGEGIFFSSKAVDSFSIFSDGLHFFPLDLNCSDADSVLSSINIEGLDVGTFVMFTVLLDHSQTMNEIFDKYTQEPDHYGFTKTIVPVKLLEYGDDSALFISRSQAKRLIVRFERFNHIDLDFEGIPEIGQGFADEIFRVFSLQHPDTKLNAVNCSQQVQNMINRIKYSAT